MSRNGGNEDYYDDEDFDYDSAEDQDVYEYDGSDDDGGVSDGDDRQAMETDDVDVDDAKEKGYDFETEDDVRRCQDEVTAAISEQLSLPRGFAAALLRHCRWDAEHLQNEWFSDEGRIRAAAGLTAGRDVPTALNDRPLTCAICFDTYAPGEMRSAGCSHYYCHECWRGYIHAAVGDGSRCLVLRCPAADPPCPAPVVRELVDAVAGDEDRARYATFVVRSFVEEGTNKYVRWCPGPGCTLAVRSHPGSCLYEVPCPCKHVFCFRCGEEAHRPASCDRTREWVARNSSDGETMNWVLANTKHCPECKRAIEKNQGCNHMTCGAPCRHEFCWICLGSWKDHSGTNYHCNVYAANPSEFDEATTRREQAKASLERYLHYYERWCAHGASMEKARQSLGALVEGGGLDGLAGDMGVPPTELDFVLEAYEQIIEARRVLRWTYVYVYYLDPEGDEVKRTLCEYLQGEAERSLERLHGCAERKRKEGEGEAEAAEEEFGVFQPKLCNLNLVTRNHFSKLVEGFESGLAEVVS